MDWNIFFSAFGGTTTALPIAAYLSNAIYQHWLKKDFKRFEQKLDDISRRQEIQFSWLHQERAKVITEIYAMIANANSLSKSIHAQHRVFETEPLAPSAKASLIKQMGESVPKMSAAVNEIKNIIDAKAIYFSGEALKQLLLVKLSLDGIATIHEFKTDALMESVINGRTMTNLIDDAMTQIQSYFNPALKALEEEFQTLLAVENQTNSPKE